MANFSKYVPISVRLFSFSIAVQMVFVIGFLGFSETALSAGEKYGEQGHALAGAIERELIRHGYCKDYRDCFDKLPLYGGHGDRVNFTLYGVGNKEKRAMLAVIVEFVTRQGLEVTQGISIQIQAFPKSHDEYVNFKNFFSKKPIIKLELNE